MAKGEANLCPLATHRRVPLWPKGEAGLRLLGPSGHTLREVASPPLAREGDGHLWPKGSHPSLATHWPQRDGHRREAFAPALPRLAT